MDGISFYEKEGVYAACKATGLSGENFSPTRFEQTLENMSEFIEPLRSLHSDWILGLLTIELLNAQQSLWDLINSEFS